MVIATPGRLIDHLQRRTVDLSRLKTLVIDEADQMLLMGFKNEVETIIKDTPKNKANSLVFLQQLISKLKSLHISI